MHECKILSLEQENKKSFHLTLLVDGEKKEFVFDIAYAKIGDVTAPVIQEQIDFYKLFWDHGGVRDEIKSVLKRKMLGEDVEFPLSVIKNP